MKCGLKIYLLLAFVFSSTVFAKSLEWQKIELEKTVSDQYREAINSVIKENEFFVQTEVKYNDPGMPEFDDLNEDNFKISDTQFDDSKGDYIAFAKVGLEVPVVGKMYKENQRKLREMYRYNESFDLFKNIQSIDVVVNVDESLSTSKYAMVEEVVKQVKVSIANFAPKVQVKQVKLSEIVKANGAGAVNDSLGIREILELLGQFGNAIGMILTILLLGFFAYKMLKMYMEFMERLKAMEGGEEKTSEEKEEEDDDVAAAMDEATGPFDPAMETETASFDKFEKLVKLNPQLAIILVKRWLKLNTSEREMALTAIAQQASSEMLELIFGGLNVQEREQWKESIHGYLDGQALVSANKLVSEGVVKELVGGSFIDDYEIIDLILGMDTDTIKSYILERDNFGKILCNIINPSVVSELINDLDEDQVDQIVSSSLEFDPQTVKSELPAFKEDLKAFCHNAQVRPFNYKLLQVVGDIAPEKETMLYRLMAQEARRSEIIAAAVKNIPSELILRLPKATLEYILKSYPMEKKIQLLASSDDEQADFILNSFTEEGSNAREMILMELDSFKGDELRLKRTQAKAHEFWKDFVVFSRDSLAHNKEIRGEVESLVEEWVDQLREEYGMAA